MHPNTGRKYVYVGLDWRDKLARFFLYLHLCPLIFVHSSLSTHLCPLIYSNLLSFHSDVTRYNFHAYYAKDPSEKTKSTLYAHVQIESDFDQYTKSYSMHCLFHVTIHYLFHLCVRTYVPVSPSLFVFCFGNQISWLGLGVRYYFFQYFFLSVHAEFLSQDFVTTWRHFFIAEISNIVNKCQKMFPLFFSIESLRPYNTCPVKHTLWRCFL